MMSHPSVLGSTGLRQLKSDISQAFEEQRREIWLKEKVSASVVVGSGEVTLADVQRWLREALNGTYA